MYYEKDTLVADMLLNRGAQIDARNNAGQVKDVVDNPNFMLVSLFDLCSSCYDDIFFNIIIIVLLAS